MPVLVYVNPSNYTQQYRTMVRNDPNVPAGWALQGGVDGAIDVPQQNFVPGSASGGFPYYPIIPGVPASPTSANIAAIKANIVAQNGSRSPGGDNGPL